MSTLSPLSTALICADTPTVNVRDNRGLSVRTLQYNRNAPADAAHQLISQQRYGVRGELLSSIDPRLFAERQSNPNVLPNFRYQTSLSGQVLRTQSQDAGNKVVLYDVENGPVWQADSREQIKRVAYDVLHRPVTVFEQDGPAACERISERYVYGENEAGAAQANARGQLLRHYDTAGLNAIPSYSCTGQPLLQERQLLSDPFLLPDWQGSEANWATAVASEVFSTQMGYNALGEAVKNVDARGNQQHQHLNIAGQLARSTLCLEGQIVERPMLNSIHYSAAGQVLREEAGNGVVTDYSYEAQTQRLSRLLTTRPGQSGREPVLQDLNYSYDPVGNILSIGNAALPVSYHRNQRIAPANDYQYDAFYQLISASGRENVSAREQSQGLPAPEVPLSADPNQFSQYTRLYHYDDGGNLTQIRHQGRNNYTLNTVMSPSSNHGVQQSGHILPSDVEAFFDACGNLTQLAPGQPLHWDGRNQLQRVIQVTRPVGEDDAEYYQYDGGGQRVRKTTITQMSGAQRTAEVIYLPGLELRRTFSRSAGSATAVEDLQVIQVDSAGRQQVRVLHWNIGRPADIANDQLRGSLGNQIGSSVLELDQSANVLTVEEYFPYGGTAVWSGASQSETQYKFVRYSGKELDATGLYYYGYRYYAPWLGRWLNPDPAGTADGLNLYRMVRNNPIRMVDLDGLAPLEIEVAYQYMLNAGSGWGEGFGKGKNNYKNFKHRTEQNLSALRDMTLDHAEHDFVEGIKSESLYAVHFSPSDLRTEAGDVTFRSRKSLLMRGAEFNAHHTDEADLEKLATTDFTFYSVELGVEPKKENSRFGANRYRIPIENALKDKYGKYAHLQTHDLLNPQFRPNDYSENPERKPEWLHVDDVPHFHIIPNMAGTATVTLTDQIFSADNIQEALALNIVKDIRVDQMESGLIYNASTSKARDNIVNTFYRPQLLVPIRLRLSKHDYEFRPPPSS
ncbi:RHS repeat protein [Pseudomonas atacamensis]|uniref:RHS repeat-associated core domain-containing protein n=1 Tax=Pseudomonas atacamensis TaxID=2565368 RepID=UPI001C3CADA7|nr:RHS repeat-associated core domain-containing protein [Pseudomonas atacamensis]QXH74807.1 RHS repeat protein [Pseudomonas atacamensis]